jgi:hypothetical protein
MLPKKDGFSLAKEVRAANKQVPIIFLTAKSMKEDTLEGFRVGADDYLTKPFSMEELLLRMKAILRRTQPAAGQGTGGAPVYTVGAFTFDYEQQLLRHGDKSVKTDFQGIGTAEAAVREPEPDPGTCPWPSSSSGATTLTSTPAAWTCTSPSSANTSRRPQRGNRERARHGVQAGGAERWLLLLSSRICSVRLADYVFVSIRRSVLIFSLVHFRGFFLVLHGGLLF